MAPETLANPYGWGIYLYVGQTSNVAAARGIDEWLPPAWDQRIGLAFFASMPLSPSNQFNVLVEPDERKAKAVCAVLNSALFFASFFLLKEESTGRYINIRSIVHPVP